ncbi:NERD domain-containing protein [Bacillus freudenreichii]|nr:NERD domain-containing protein [Bacillus freudenreichii]
MIIKPYKEPLTLRIFRCLEPRLKLDSYYRQQYLNLEKGHEGEESFAELLVGISNGYFILHDLLLEYNGSLFQIDALLMNQKKIYLFDVKNFEGDFYIDSNIWYAVNGKEIKDPVLQLTRCESLLRQLLQDNRLNLPIEARIIFINWGFTLYQAPLNLPIILPTQLNRLLKQLNMDHSQPDSRRKKLSEKLARDHIIESPFNQLPQYDYAQLKKGIVCIRCNSLLTSLINHRYIVCSRCSTREKVEVSVMRSVNQLQLLFPDTILTTNRIHDWCKIIESKRMIRRILRKHFTIAGHGKYTYYVDRLIPDSQL